MYLGSLGEFIGPGNGGKLVSCLVLGTFSFDCLWVKLVACHVFIIACNQTLGIQVLTQGTAPSQEGKRELHGVQPVHS